MPKLFITNLEETAPAADDEYTPVYVPKIKHITPRFIHYLEEDDVIVLPTYIPENFLNYYSKIYGYQLDSQKIITLKTESSPYLLIDSLMQDKETIEILKQWNREEEWILDACLYTPKLQTLSDLLGMPIAHFKEHTLPGELILQFNQKSYFKLFLQARGFPVVPGYIANSKEELMHCINLVSRENNDKIIIKKPLYGGGLGNISGRQKCLLSLLDQWYQGGSVIVEHFMDTSLVSGTLVKLHESIDYIGSNVQFFEEGKWVGFSYPLSDHVIARQLRQLSLEIAKELYQEGIRGDLNLDWAIVNDHSHIPKIYALECNLRYNGFGIIVDCGEKYFQSYQKNVFYQGDFEVNGDMKEFLKKIDPYLIKTTGEKEGVILITPPEEKKLSFAIFADDERKVNQIHAHFKALAR